MQKTSVIWMKQNHSELPIERVKTARNFYNKNRYIMHYDLILIACLFILSLFFLIMGIANAVREVRQKRQWENVKAGDVYVFTDSIDNPYEESVSHVKILDKRDDKGTRYVRYIRDGGSVDTMSFSDFLLIYTKAE